MRWHTYSIEEQDKIKLVSIPYLAYSRPLRIDQSWGEVYIQDLAGLGIGFEFKHNDMNDAHFAIADREVQRGGE
jgi:hypothetical protein